MTSSLPGTEAPLLEPLSGGVRGSLLYSHERRGRQRYTPWTSLLLILFAAPFVIVGGMAIWGWFGIICLSGFFTPPPSPSMGWGAPSPLLNPPGTTPGR